MSNIDPSILSSLEEERTYAKSGGSNTNRLKLDKDTSALIRFLPVYIGTNKAWFGRVGLHWIGKRPVNCPRTTSPSLGGSPDAHCACCSMVEKLSSSRSKEVQSLVNKAASWPQWLTYVLVFEVIDAKNRSTPTPQNEIWIPNEFWMPKTAWLELSAIYKRKFEREKVDIVDPENGYDILVSKNNRGDLSFQLDKQGPLVEGKTGADMADFVDKLCNFKLIDTAPASDQKLEEAAMKLEDIALGSAGRGDGGGRRSAREGEPPARSRSAVDVDDDSPPVVRGRAAPLEEDVPYSQPARRVAPEQAARTAEPPTTRREAPPVSRQAEPPPSARSEPPARRQVEPPPARRTALPPESNDNDPDAVPPEVRDPAPAADASPEPDEAPPDFPPSTPVSNPPRARMSDRMAESMSRVAQSRAARTA